MTTSYDSLSDDDDLFDDLPYDTDDEDDEEYFGVDWDGDGKISQDDEIMTFIATEDLIETSKSGNGSCLVAFFLLPAYAIAMLLKQRGLL